MTEREFEKRLRAFYRTEVDATGQVPGALRDSVLAIPDGVLDRAGLFGPRRRIVLLAAAMLTALLVGGAIALGSGLLRLPWQQPDRITTIAFSYSIRTDEGVPVPCDQTLPDGLLLSVEPQLVGVDSRDGPRLYLYEDGQLLRRPWVESSDSASLWSQRRLSPEGLQRLLATVEATGLKDCHGVPTWTPPLRVIIKAKTGDGVVAMSFGPGTLRTVTRAELDVAADLGDQFISPDLDIPPSEWIDPDWQPYAPDRWEILISRWDSLDPPVSDNAQEGPWADLVLPDGSTFLTFGSSVPVDPDSTWAEHRCRVVDRDEVEAMTAFLGEPLALEPVTNEGTWQFWDAPLGGGVEVRLSPLPRHNLGCGSDGAAPPDAPGGDPIDGMRVCDYLPEIALTWYRPGERTDFGGGWAACSYPTGAWVFASRYQISSAGVLDLVKAQFGVDGFTTDEIAGRTVYFNSCDEVDCLPAVAISAEPHFVIVVPVDYLGSDLRELAESVIQRINQGTEPG